MYSGQVDNDTVRTVITFANRAVADEWWRAISTSNNPLLLNNTQRITPYLYSFRDSYQWYLTNFFTEPQLKSIADDFKGKMFFQPASAPDGSSVDIIIPTPPIVDHVSGDWYISCANHVYPFGIFLQFSFQGSLSNPK